jgi:WD40 repeat protein
VVVYSAWFSPDGQRVLTTSLGHARDSQIFYSDGTAARVWDAATGKEVGKTEGFGDICVAFSPDSRSVVVAGGNAPRIWLPETGEERHLKGHDGNVGAAAFSPDGQQVVTAADDRTVRIWNTATGQQMTVLKGHQEGVTFVSWSPDGRWIASVGKDKTARIWEAETFKEYLTLRWPEREVEWAAFSFEWAAFSADGRRVLTQTNNGARLWPIDVLDIARQRKPRELTAEERERFEIGTR